jgi:hypothetical protein
MYVTNKRKGKKIHRRYAVYSASEKRKVKGKELSQRIPDRKQETQNAMMIEPSML